MNDHLNELATEIARAFCKQNPSINHYIMTAWFHHVLLLGEMIQKEPDKTEAVNKALIAGRWVPFA